MPIPNPTSKAPSTGGGTPIVGLNTKTQFYKGMNAAGTARVYHDDAGNELSEDEFKKLNPDGYTEGVASNSKMVQDQGSIMGGGTHMEVDPYAHAAHTPATGASLGDLAKAKASPSPMPSATPAKVSDIGGMLGGVMGMGGESNPIMDGLARALQYRRPFMG
jgi:hypothetical protein